MKNQRIVIVGGSSGIGLALAKRAQVLGADVIIGARNAERLTRAADEVGATGLPIDTTDELSVREFFTRIGPIDHLATPGSSVSFGPFRSTSMDDMVTSLRSKFLGQALCLKHAMVKPTGSITLFSGVLSRRPAAAPVLGAINAAVEILGAGLAMELAPIRVNTVSPGLTRDTAAFDAMPEDAREKMFAATAARLPCARVGWPQDSAEAAIYLMQNSFVTGQVLIVDGGATAL